MSKYITFVTHTESGCLIQVLYNRSGAVESASFSDKSIPINLDVTAQFQKIQNTPTAQHSWADNVMRLNLQKWFEEARKQEAQRNVTDDFDKEPA